MSIKRKQAPMTFSQLTCNVPALKMLKKCNIAQIRELLSFLDFILAVFHFRALHESVVVVSAVFAVPE